MLWPLDTITDPPFVRVEDPACTTTSPPGDVESPTLIEIEPEVPDIVVPVEIEISPEVPDIVDPVLSSIEPL